jgi:protease IV
MSEDFWGELGRELRGVGTAVGDGWRYGRAAWHNLFRHQPLDYIVLPLSGPLPERAGPPRSFIQRQLPLPPEPMSMQELNGIAQMIARADNVRGLVLVLQDVGGGLATLQNIRRTITRLREADKVVVVYTPVLTNAYYYIATAADRIVAPPSAQFEVLGVRSEAIFLKDALAKLGLSFDNIQISPYKTAANMFDKANITPEQREQLEWLLAESYDMLTEGMADGRIMPGEEMRALIDAGPYSAAQALAYGLVDNLAYEDELADILAVRPDLLPPPEWGMGGEANLGETVEAEGEGDDEGEDEGGEEEAKPRAKLISWEEGAGQLMVKPYRIARQAIGVVSLEGMITMGESQRPPIDIPLPLVGGESAGEQTVVQLLRRAEEDDQIAALILHVDSGGGSALASDLIGRQVQKMAAKKPVLVYMGNVAASGGYYVSAHATTIMSQPGTITGSIGVVMGRLSTGGLYEKLGVTRVSLQQGARAGLYSDEHPLTAEEREVLWQSIVTIYDQFKQVVADGRNLPYETLDPLCEGRVWTGRQALAKGLVDVYGDFVDAIEAAAKLAGLPYDENHFVPVVTMYPERDDSYLLAQPWEEMQGWLRGMAVGRVQALAGPQLLLPFEWKIR